MKTLVCFLALAWAAQTSEALPPHDCWWVRLCYWQAWQVCANNNCGPWHYDLVCDYVDLYCVPPPHDPIYGGDLPSPPGPPGNPRDVNRDGKLDCWKQAVKDYDGSGTCCQQWGATDAACNPPCGRGHQHAGQDLAAPCGTPVRAAGRGIVYAMGWNNPTMGNWVQIKLTDGRYVVYMHLASIEGWVYSGARTYPGQILGTVGDTGSASGCHLHLQVQPYPTCPRASATPWIPRPCFRTVRRTKP